MIAFDTNVLVRLLVADDPRQARRARELVVTAAERGERVLIGDIVLCELEWVLESAYKVPRREIAAAVAALDADERFCFENAERVRRALEHYLSSRADLSDLLLGLRASAAGAGTTHTFDRRLREIPVFNVLD